MNCSLPFSRQPKQLKDEIRHAALQKFPVLEDYHRLWPVDDLVRYHLKYQKSALRRKGNDVLIAQADAESKRRANEVFIETLANLRQAHAHTQAEALQAQIQASQGQSSGRNGGSHPKRRRKLRNSK
ncbi:hypothetical protein VNI00_018109 [Paramarasmius palmivorus]